MSTVSHHALLSEVKSVPKAGHKDYCLNTEKTSVALPSTLSRCQNPSIRHTETVALTWQHLGTQVTSTNASTVSVPGCVCKLPLTAQNMILNTRLCQNKSKH